MKQTFRFKRNKGLFIISLAYLAIIIAQTIVDNEIKLGTYGYLLLCIGWMSFSNGFKFKRIVLSKEKYEEYNSVNYKFRSIHLSEIHKASMIARGLYITLNDGQQINIAEGQLKANDIEQLQQMLSKQA